MRVRKLKKQETRAVMPVRVNDCPGVFAVGAMAVVVAVMMMLASTPGLAETIEGWGDAELVETNDGSASSPRVAMDGDGNAIAVWVNDDGDQGSIWSNRYVVGIGWGDAELIETNDGSASYPQIAMDEDGNAIVVWQQYDPIMSIWSNRYVVGVGWGIAQLIEAEDGYAHYPQVAMDGDGNAIAVWLQYDVVRGSIWSNRYVAGVGWGVAQLIEAEDGYDAYSPQVAMDEDGNAIVVWAQEGGIVGGTMMSIWSNRFYVGVGWASANFFELDVDSGGASYPQVAVGGDGNAVAVWEQADGTRKSIWSNRYVIGIGWGDVQLIEAYDEYEYEFGARVAVDRDGNAIAVWRYVYSAEQGIWSNRYVVGVGWGDAEPVEIDSLSAGSPQVAMDRDGNAIAVWEQWDGQNSIWSNRYVVGVGWGHAQPIDAEDGYSFLPQVAMDRNGNAIAVWSQFDDSQCSIWSNRFTASSNNHQFRHCNSDL